MLAVSLALRLELSFHAPLALQRGCCFQSGALVFPEIELLSQHAEDMLQRKMCLLNVHGHIGWNPDQVIAEGRHGASRSAGQANRRDAHLTAQFQCAKHVRRATGGRDANKDVAAFWWRTLS